MTAPILAAALAAVTCLGPHIHDGDTLTCAGVKVRLYGVNSPEIPPKPLEPGGYEARDALVRLAGGKTLTCTPFGNQHDRYRRMVARCSVNGRDLGALMLGGGFACVWRRYDTAHVYVGVGANCDKNGKPQ